MKKYVMGIAAAILIMAASLGHAETLDIVAEENWIPYAVTEDGAAKGYSAEVIQHVLERLEVAYTVTPYPWKRALDMVMEGKAAGVYNASLKPDRAEKCFYPAEPLLNSQYVFFILKKNVGTLKYESFEDLKGHSLGLCDEYSYSPEFMEFAKAHENVINAPNDEILLKMVGKGRIDFFPAELGNGMTILKKLGLESDVTYLPKPLLEKPYYIIFNKELVEQSFVDQFSEALKAFKATPEFQAIYNKYFQ